VEFKKATTIAVNNQAGKPINFEVAVLNKNNYPVAAGMVYAKIYRRDKTGNSFLIDEFVAKDNVNLWQNEQKTIDFAWTSPEKSMSGNYRADLFFVASKQFNLAGLVNSSGIAGATVPFTIQGQEQGFWIDESKIQLDGKKISAFAAATINYLELRKSVEVSIPLNGDLNGGKAKISYSVFKDNSLAEKDIIEQKSRNLLLRKGQMIKFYVPTSLPGAYFVQVLAEGNGQKSAAEIRYNVTNAERFRGSTGHFVFAGLSSFPLKKGEKFNLFSCFVNAADNTSFGGKLKVQLQDESGKVLVQLAEDEFITPEVRGIKKEFTAPKNSGKVLLTAQLLDSAGKVLSDKVDIEYNLDNFSKLAAAPAVGVPLIVWILIAAFVVIIAIILFFVFKKMRATYLIIPFIFLSFGLASSAFAGSATPTDTFTCDKNEQACCPSGLTSQHDTYYSNGNDQAILTLNNGTQILLQEGTPVSVCNQGETAIKDIKISLDMTNGNWFDPPYVGAQPPINWVNSISDYYNANTKCNQQPYIQDFECPNNVSPIDSIPGWDTLSQAQKDDAILYWLQTGCGGVYNDPTFNLPTYFTYYDNFGNNGPACIGTQINCERNPNLLVTGPLDCHLLGKSELDCGPAGTETGLANVKLTNNFSCFAYYDRGIFSYPYKWTSTDWDPIGPDSCPQQPPPAQTCWCKTKITGTGRNQYCLGLYYPLKVTNPVPLPSIISSYNIQINDCPTNVPPTATPLPNPVVGCVSSPSYTLSWSFNDLDGDQQKAYRVQIFDDSGYSHLVQDTQLLGIGDPSNSNQYLATNLQFDKTYYWQVMVEDTKDAWSTEWAKGGPFTTGTQSPTANFDIPQQSAPIQLYDKDSKPTKKVVEYAFASKSSCDPCSSYSWTFAGWPSSLNPGNSNLQNVPEQVDSPFQPKGTETIQLTVGANGCFNTTPPKYLTGAKYPPSWIEIPPFSKINNFLAQIIAFFR